MISTDVIILGGGAAGMFAAAVLAEEAPWLQVLVLEKGAMPLAKVRVTGGGRCNVTHACADVLNFAQQYPRGGRELIGPLNRFGPAETVAWFETHGVPLVTRDDGCVFPRSDTSEDIIHALLAASGAGHVKIRTRAEGSSVRPVEGGVEVTLVNGEPLFGRKLLVATGGGACVKGLGHTIESCVPSLFTFNTPDMAFAALAGMVVDAVQVGVGKCKADGALLITHSGVSGPAVLRLSSLGARTLAELNYQFAMKINWLPGQSAEESVEWLGKQRAVSPRKQVGTWSPLGLSARLWKLLVSRAEVDESREWAACSSKTFRQIAAQVHGFTLPVSGKNPHREEFVTCGGIRLKEVNFKTLESRLVPGLYFAGEVLDVDAQTGGFNLQAAWTTGFLAAQAIIGADVGFPHVGSERPL